MSDPETDDPTTGDPTTGDPTTGDPETPPQVVVRPPGVLRGAPPPWAAVAAPRRRGVRLGHVADALRAAGQWGSPPEREDVAPAVDVFDPGAPAAAASAVLVALFEEAGEARVVLTRRSSTLRAHRGEVSFPGGRVDDGEDATSAALREAEEEVALDRRLVRTVGWLRPVLTFSSGSLITPVVATLERRPDLVPSPDEVERVFDVALADLAADGAFHEELWPLPRRLSGNGPERRHPVWFFAAAGETIWGATARVLVELVTLVLGVPAGTGAPA